MHRFTGLLLFLAFIAFTLLSVLVEDSWIRVPAVTLAVVALIVSFIAMPAARAALADRFPPVAWLGRRIMALRWRTLGLVFAGCVAALFAAEALEDATEPKGRLADHLAARYLGGRDERPPLTVSVELD
jgi:MFS family permease